MRVNKFFSFVAPLAQFAGPSGETGNFFVNGIDASNLPEMDSHLTGEYRAVSHQITPISQELVLVTVLFEWSGDGAVPDTAEGIERS